MSKPKLRLPRDLRGHVRRAVCKKIMPFVLLMIAFGAVLVFVGQAFIQTLMLMFLADTVEYGHWKLGKRNESITFSIQPFINKIGGALATGIVSLTLIFSGIKIDGGTVDAITGATVTSKAIARSVNSAAAYVTGTDIDSGVGR